MEFSANDLRRIADALDLMGEHTRSTGMVFGVYDNPAIGEDSNYVHARWDAALEVYVAEVRND